MAVASRAHSQLCCVGQRWNLLQDVLYLVLKKFGRHRPWIPHVSSECALLVWALARFFQFYCFAVTNAAGDKCCSFQGKEVHHVQASNLFFFYFRGLKAHKYPCVLPNSFFKCNWNIRVGFGNMMITHSLGIQFVHRKWAFDRLLILRVKTVLTFKTFPIHFWYLFPFYLYGWMCMCWRLL